MATKRAEIADIQRQSIANTLNNETFCDVTFLIGPNQTEFRANRMLLAAISEAFKAMLYGSMKEGQPNSIVSIPDIDVKGFKGVLDFAYCKDPSITVENVVSISNVAQKYQISTLSPICAKYFSTFIDKTSICSLINDAANLHLTHLIETCAKAMQESLGYHAKEITESEAFLKMGLPAMKVFLQMDYLQIKEEELWEAVLKWAKHRQHEKKEVADFTEGAEPSSKRQKLNDGSAKSKEGESAESKSIGDLKTLRHYMRFGNMNGKYFVQKVQPTKCLSNKEIKQISNYILCDGEQSSCGTFSVTKRAFRFTIKRGDIQWNRSYGVYSNNSKEAIAIKTDCDARLIGIGILDCMGKMTVSVKIYKGTNDQEYNRYHGYTDPFPISELKEVSFVRPKPSSDPIRLDFKPHISMKRNVLYTVEILKTNQDQKRSYIVQNGKTSVTHFGLTVSFENAKRSGCTNRYSGAIPSFYFLKE